MSLGIKLDVVKGLGHGQAGDRVARVIFRGDFQLTYLLGPKMVNDHIDRYCVVPGVSKATKVFEQRGDTCFINQVRCFVMAACGIFNLYDVQSFDDQVPDKSNDTCFINQVRSFVMAQVDVRLASCGM